MNFALTINSKHSIKLSHAELGDLLYFLGDDPLRADFYKELANHPSSQLRTQAAKKTCLPLDTLEKLSQDVSVDVVMAVAQNETALKNFNCDQIYSMICRDVSIALEIATNIELLDPDAGGQVLEELHNHSDPDVRAAVDFEADLE